MSVLSKLVRDLFRAGGGNGLSAAREGAVDCGEVLKQAEAAAANGRLNAALELYKTAIEKNPESVDAWLGAAAVLVDLWALGDAVAAYERALELAPKSNVIFSALLFHRHYDTPVDARRLFELHREYGMRMDNSFPRAPAKSEGRVDLQRRLRIGYVSPNLSRHSVGYFIEPVIRSHNRREFEVYCYYNHALADDATGRMREAADGWRDVAGIDDESLARMVHEDKIDILVDLAGHSKGNRLGAFARCHAPLQFTWLGYPDTTGLATIGYRITDNTADPAPAADLKHTEQLARIDGCFLCYEPPADAPAIKKRAADSVVTFGSFNNVAKINRPLLELWAKILTAVPDSRLMLKCAPLNFPDTVDRLTEALEECGIEPSRVELRGWTSGRDQHLDAYAEIDIALDTFPYNGTTTTCEALWMGVPVVTLAGEVHMSRVGASLLHCAGLDDLVAQDEAQYVRIAAALAGDVERREGLRSGLRARLLGSSLLDHAGFTRKLESVYRAAWARSGQL